ncbi:thiazole synthase [Hydrogenibacillus schlegelii]|uniref:Thiazole synthase n=1 Tax=Hydrogenibacillus schlegelii TaxID=1484 RepID=A0A132MI25_HYDSH|nr:thiazole synthase [Hydrogenibacillus schlegelii]KWW97071.1 thiazole synthase [Hydrogenibacillus schlegelii]OAR03397.1 thiazole synthase [Hydrogenibacillus schlegelii]
MQRKNEDDFLTIGPYAFRSRLFLGTGKYPSVDVQKRAIEASGAEVVTFAVRRVDLERREGVEGVSGVLEGVDLSRHRLLPNTAGARTAEEAIRLARLAKASGLSSMIKVEIVGDTRTLLPDPIETLKATEALVREGFIVLAYTSDDPVLAKRLEAVGAHAVMPGAAPIGTGLGILNPYALKLIVESVRVPVIVDAGLGAPSDVALALELGADAVLVNTAVAEAKDPVKMAEAMRHAVLAGRMAYRAGRMPKRAYASASSPMEGMIT